MIEVFLASIAGGGLSGIILIYLTKHLLIERLKNSVSHQYNKKLEELKQDIRDREFLSRKQWEIKHEAFSKALAILDALLSHRDKETGPAEQQLPGIEVVRACFNDLLICSSDPLIVKGFRCAVDTGTKPEQSQIGRLRDLMRLDLGFVPLGQDEDQDPWISNIR